MMAEVEIKESGSVYEIHLKEGRIGSIWRNREGSITVKINPEYWSTLLKISDGRHEIVTRLMPKREGS
ncbi:MAG: hypothetical protein KAX31_04480 [Thermoplasmata archaeon]|nr:hypothetical protein [Thermoplasmata archaeon]